MFTIEEVQGRTGLDISVLRKYIQNLKTELNPYIRRGENNRLLFDSSSIIIWDKIKELKEQGYTLPTIKQELERIQKGRGEAAQTEETVSNEGIAKVLKPDSKPDNLEGALMKELIEAHKATALEKDKRLADKDEFIKVQKELNETTKILLALPDGKSPEQIKKDLAEMAEKAKKAEGRGQEALKLANELGKAAGFFKRGKRKRILKRLHELEGAE